MRCPSPLSIKRWIWLLSLLFSAPFESLVDASTRRRDGVYTGTSVAFVPNGSTNHGLSLTTPSFSLPAPLLQEVRGASPPTGAVYKKTLPIPVLGRQSFHLRILSDRRAHLRIDGVLSVDEILDYKVKPCGAFSILIPDGLQNLLRKFRTRLVEFGYDSATDLPYVVVSPPLPTKIRIQLARVQAPVASVIYHESMIVCSD